MYINRESFTIDFNAGLTRTQLAKKYGCSITTIRHRLMEYGLITCRKNKKRSEGDRNNRPTPAQLKDWKEKADRWTNLVGGIVEITLLRPEPSNDQIMQIGKLAAREAGYNL